MSPVQNARRNLVLELLPDDVLQRLEPYLHEVTMGRGDILYDSGHAVPAVHFPLNCVVSLLQPIDNQDTFVEVATVGRDGMSGISVFLGSVPAERAIVQVPGRAMTMTSEQFRRQLVELDGPLQGMMRRYTHALVIQLSRNTACNRAHPVHQRAARWLLMTADRVGSDTFELTQQFLGHMLGVRRATVGDVAKKLADEAVITYNRGVIRIIDRNRLHAASCSCYDLINTLTAQALHGS